jgi:hypothetical protein
MILDLNHLTDERNYTAEEPSGSSFFAGIFPNYDQIKFKIQYLILIKTNII